METASTTFNVCKLLNWGKAMLLGAQPLVAFNMTSATPVTIFLAKHLDNTVGSCMRFLNSWDVSSVGLTHPTSRRTCVTHDGTGLDIKAWMLAPSKLSSCPAFSRLSHREWTTLAPGQKMIFRRA